MTPVFIHYYKNYIKTSLHYLEILWRCSKIVKNIIEFTNNRVEKIQKKQQISLLQENAFKKLYARTSALAFTHSTKRTFKILNKTRPSFTFVGSFTLVHRKLNRNRRITEYTTEEKGFYNMLLIQC